jgi:hypothetical protein
VLIIKPVQNKTKITILDGEREISHCDRERERGSDSINTLY